jgi:1-deoxy-D-xylulose-5-phosphate reductoisomerase
MERSRGVVVLGSTGSVGKSTLEVIDALSHQFHIVGLAAHSNADLLQSQIRKYRPDFVSLAHSNGRKLDGAVEIDSEDPLAELSTLESADIVVVATTGHAAIPATLSALRAGKIVALANKETIVAAGEIVIPLAQRYPGNLRAVDSEHSAIWQCLPPSGVTTPDVERILLTASGGPFRGYSKDDLDRVDVATALAHPTWTMGARITIDSATMMNKGFELIEAAWLFDCSIDDIEIVVHPQSIVHSMVEYADGSIIAHLASHDMKLPIQYALTYPERPPGPAERLSIDAMRRLEFEPPDFETFRSPLLAKQAFSSGSTYPAVLSRADEVAVQAFLAGRIPFNTIVDLVERALDAHVPAPPPTTLEAISRADDWTTRFLKPYIAKSGQ